MYQCRILQLLLPHDDGDDGGDGLLRARDLRDDVRRVHRDCGDVRVLPPRHLCVHRHDDALFHQSMPLMLPPHQSQIVLY